MLFERSDGAGGKLGHSLSGLAWQGRNAAALVNSGASVAFYSEEFQQRFMVGRDGYINVSSARIALAPTS